MLASTLCLGLLLQAQDAPVAPFQFSLPVEYGPFTRMRGAADEWESLRADREGRFSIAHLVLAERGATSERVAQDLRQRKWTPLMSQREHQMEPWQGTWAGGSASGTQLSFQINGMAKAIWERVFLHGDRLLVGSWEGPLSELEAATRALDSFRPPAEWRASPPVDVDPAKGAGPSAEVHPSIGHFDIHLLVPSGLTQPSVELSFTPEVPAQEPLEFLLPGGERTFIKPQEGVYKLDYELPLGSESQGEWGVWRESRATAFLTPSWLAYPIPLDGTPLMGVVQPPSWTLSATVPATEQGLSWCPPTTDTIQGSEAGRKLIWPRHPKNQSWPFLLTGPYLPAQVGGLTLHLRPGAKSSRTLPAAAWLASLFDSAQSQYQGSRRTPMIATFPNCGDRIFPGLWILDESQKWLGASLDEAHGLLNRRVGFAELLGTSLFGGEVRGKGSARPFLEISLAEYVAMRLLENSLHPELADRLKETWREHDRSSGPLQQPLSLTERSDLEGPKRLLSTGPLTYLHIESMVGRPAFDLILRQALHSQALWTTEDLRTSLEASSDHDWKSFFDQHIYGRVPLPTLPITPPK